MRSRPTLSTKLLAMGAGFLLVALASIGLTLWVTWKLEGGAAAVNEALKAASESSLGVHMGFTEEPLVSIDFRGSTHGGVVDALSTQVLDGTMVKVLIWYDNEAGFTNQLLRLLRMVGGTC